MSGQIRSVEVPLRTLAESHEAIEKIAHEVSSLLYVAAVDVQDVYGNAHSNEQALISLFGEGGSHPPTPLSNQFARMLVERLLHSDEVLLEWVGEESNA